MKTTTELRRAGSAGVARARPLRALRYASVGLMLAVLHGWTWLAAPTSAFAHGTVPPTLKGVEVPEGPGLYAGKGSVIRNRKRAIELGKALFWDVQVGSDGQACASCHHHAGADGRTTNQLSPGHAPETRPSAATFQPAKAGAGGPNYLLRLSDFPLHQLTDPADIASAVLFDTDDVVGSAGSYGGTFQGSSADSSMDVCARAPDPTFHVQGVGVRRVTSRNAPSIFNAAFQRRSFWDGRANNVFNGVSPYGDRDPAAGVWQWRDRHLSFDRFGLTESALASQAVAPPLDPTEMSCAGRTLPDVGRKLLGRRALQLQRVHSEDGVLGRLRHRKTDGLAVTYRQMIRRAFHRRFWAAPDRRTHGAFGAPAAGGAPYDQTEANFGLFFGLAIQAYEATLISDDAPFDSPRDGLGLPTALDEQQRRGLTAFVDFHCADCHSGPVLSGGVLAGTIGATEVDRKPIRASDGSSTLGLTDTAFVHTSVVPPDHDVGVGGTDPFGNPLSLTEQYLGALAGIPGSVRDPMTVLSCAMTAPFAATTFGQPPFPPAELVADPAGSLGCASPLLAWVPTAAVVTQERALPAHGRLPDGTVAAFKVPSLRNIELTGPYMHNGGMGTLEEVVEFYDRGGNFSAAGKDAQFLFSVGLAPKVREDIVAFLKALTDERVRWERAPFDHPSLPLAHGHAGDETSVVTSADPAFAGLAETVVVDLPEVGASGRTSAQGPLASFAERVAP